MKNDAFKEILLKRGIHFFNKDDVRGLLSSSRKLKEFFKNIDFDCQITEDGSCKRYENALSKCCCFDCLSSGGYFYTMADEEIPYYAKKFSVKTGFWRKGKGCILPHKRRSVVCLCHNCNEDHSFDKGISTLGKKLRDLRMEVINATK